MRNGLTQVYGPKRDVPESLDVAGEFGIFIYDLHQAIVDRDGCVTTLFKLRGFKPYPSRRLT